MSSRIEKLKGINNAIVDALETIDDVIKGRELSVMHIVDMRRRLAKASVYAEFLIMEDEIDAKEKKQGHYTGRTSP